MPRLNRLLRKSSIHTFNRLCIRLNTRQGRVQARRHIPSGLCFRKDGAIAVVPHVYASRVLLVRNINLISLTSACIYVP